MDKIIQTNLQNLWVEDRELQNKAFFHIIEVTDRPVKWAYEAWDDVVKNLKHHDNHNRAIAAQVLCNLAKSDLEERILKDLPVLIAVTKDEKFVTARHCMQALWKVGAAGKKQQQKLIAGLENRFQECIAEKNCTLIRYDIIQDFRHIYDAVHDEKVKEKALALIETETDLKYRKKYAGVWKTQLVK
jgi:hypothetical protein